MDWGFPALPPLDLTLMCPQEAFWPPEPFWLIVSLPPSRSPMYGEMSIYSRVPKSDRIRCPRLPVNPGGLCYLTQGDDSVISAACKGLCTQLITFCPSTNRTLKLYRLRKLISTHARVTGNQEQMGFIKRFFRFLNDTSQ